MVNLELTWQHLLSELCSKQMKAVRVNQVHLHYEPLGSHHVALIATLRVSLITTFQPLIMEWCHTTEPFVLIKQLLRALSLNTAWFVAHSPYLRHFRETADGSCHTSAMKQNLCRVLCSACLHNCYSACIQ